MFKFTRVMEGMGRRRGDVKAGDVIFHQGIDVGPSPLSRPESCSSAASSAQDWEQAAQATVRRNNKLSPGVTESLGLRNYLKTSGLYDTPEKHPHVPVRSVFTEAGYYSSKAALLARGADHVDYLSKVNTSLGEEVEALKKSVQALNLEITSFQSQLPTAGE